MLCKSPCGGKSTLGADELSLFMGLAERMGALGLVADAPPNPLIWSIRSRSKH